MKFSSCFTAAAIALFAFSEPMLGIVGGKEKNRADFPTIAIFESPGKLCTAVLVGAQALLTAAHCTDADGNGTVTLFNNEVHPAECIPAPDLDLAICHLSTALEGILFERVGSASPLTVGQELFLAGFGCDDVDNPTPVNPLRKGCTKIVSLIGDAVRIGEGAYLCGGDSGGPAYLHLPGEPPSRVVAGINDNNFDLTNLTTEAAQKLFEIWKESHPLAAICGFTPDAQSCRN
jgi:hypothetical protein